MPIQPFIQPAKTMNVFHHHSSPSSRLSLPSYSFKYVNPKHEEKKTRKAHPIQQTRIIGDVIENKFSHVACHRGYLNNNSTMKEEPETKKQGRGRVIIELYKRP
jgi:hypothetical protein